VVVIQSRGTRTGKTIAVAIAIRVKATVIESIPNTIIQTIHSSVATIRLCKL
jgi:hypothetical protein